MSDLEKRFPIYARLLHFYPEPYRKKYAQELLQATADLIDDMPKHRHAAIWLRVAADLPVSVATEQMQYIGGTMHETPNYIKRSSLVAGLLLVPFFAALTANTLDHVLHSQTLYQLWLWQAPFIQLWVLYLPELALLLALGSYLAYVYRGGGTRTSWRSRIFDLGHVWPVAIPVLLAGGILFILAFHDSGQCLQSPAHLAQHAGQVWQCATKNQSLPIFRRFW